MKEIQSNLLVIINASDASLFIYLTQCLVLSRYWGGQPQPPNNLVLFSPPPHIWYYIDIYHIYIFARSACSPNIKIFSTGLLVAVLKN